MLLSIFCYIFAFLHFYIIKVFEVFEVATGKPLHAGAGGVDVGIIGPRQRVGVGIVRPGCWNC